MRKLALAAALFGFAGCIQVDATDGSIACSKVAGRQCPAGFYCLQPDNTCWRDGHYPADMATPLHLPPQGGEVDMSVPSLDDMMPAADDGSTTD